MGHGAADATGQVSAVTPAPYTGIGQFGPAYGVMLENDSHGRGSVDRLLMARMVRLVSDTAAYLYAGFTPTSVHHKAGSRPDLERHAAAATGDARSSEERISAIAQFCAGLATTAPQGLDAMVVGGTEEEIITRGSDWCTDVARVGCALCQVAGLPARMVYLADVDRAYSGHAIIEVYRTELWGAVDPTTAVIYRSPQGMPLTTWRLMGEPGLIERHRQATGAAYTRPGQFARAAISNYFVWEQPLTSYVVSPLNAYYRSILEMAERGWPGGLRWLHGESAT